MIGKKLGHKLEIVWNHAAPLDGSLEATAAEHWRYVPLSLNGGTGWGVWDKKGSRFLTDSEIMNLPDEQLANERVLQS